MNNWLKHSSATTFADDTKTSVSGKRLEEIIKKLELDAINVLKFMASNELVANPSKTVLLIMNQKKNLPKVQILVGKATIIQENSAKLLGMMLDSNGDWNSHISGTGGLIPMLNKRPYLIKLLRSHLSEKNVKTVAESLYSAEKAIKVYVKSLPI